MVSAHEYPTFELSNAVQLLAKTASRERKLGPCPETPYCPETPSVTLTFHFQLAGSMQCDRSSDRLQELAQVLGRHSRSSLHVATKSELATSY